MLCEASASKQIDGCENAFIQKGIVNGSVKVFFYTESVVEVKMLMKIQYKLLNIRIFFKSFVSQFFKY